MDKLIDLINQGGTGEYDARQPQERGEAVAYGCHCDLEPHMEPDGCVIDTGRRQDCFYARSKTNPVNKKEECEYWQPIKFTHPATDADRVAELEVVAYRFREKRLAGVVGWTPCGEREYDLLKGNDRYEVQVLVVRPTPDAGRVAEPVVAESMHQTVMAAAQRELDAATRIITTLKAQLAESRERRKVLRDALSEAFQYIDKDTHGNTHSRIAAALAAEKEVE